MKKASFPLRIKAAALSLLVIAGQTLYGSPARQIQLEVSPSHPVLLSDRTQTTTIKVGLTGFDIDRAHRSPVNISLVIDRSGSMQGEKIRRAKEAAEMVVDMLGEDDIFSLVTYSSSVETLVPSTRLTEKADVLRSIRSIRAAGNTALFGGVSKGLAEVRKFQSRNQVNRVILLSDGLANVGPSTPRELGKLGNSAGREGIAVTTIGLGLGYNEDLMTQLAMNSDGNHAFVENSNDLARIFEQELGDVLSVVAQEVEIIIHCRPGIRPIRVLDRQANIKGQDVILTLNQIYSSQEKFLLLEVEVPEGRAGAKRDIAEVEVAYANIVTREKEQLRQTAMVSFDKSETTVKSSVNKKVMVESTRALANERSRSAVTLRDKGDVKGAESLMMQNAAMLKSQAGILEEPELMQEAQEAEEGAEELKKKESWGKTRKSMVKKQYKTQNQTKY